MNVDHFFFIDVDELESTGGSLKKKKAKAKQTIASLRTDGHAGQVPEARASFGRSGDTALQTELYQDFGNMPSLRKIKYDDYAAVNVAPSVVPTYLPGIRVYSYNTSDESRYIPARDDEYFEEPDVSLFSRALDLLAAALPRALSDLLPRDTSSLLRRNGGHRHKRRKHKKQHKCDRPENEDKPHCRWRRRQRHANATSPSRSNRYLSPLGYAQFYLPDLEVRADGLPPAWEIEYTTYSRERLEAVLEGTDEASMPPVPVHLLPGAGNTTSSPAITDRLTEITPFSMRDLTISSWAAFATKLVKSKNQWKRFASNM